MSRTDKLALLCLLLAALLAPPVLGALQQGEQRRGPAWAEAVTATPPGHELAERDTLIRDVEMWLEVQRGQTA